MTGVKAVSAAAKYDRENTIYTSGVDQPRDAKGKFRVVLARIKENLGTSGLQRAVERVEELENLDSAGNYAAAAASAAKLQTLLTRLDEGALNATSLENVRESARLLGQVMANLVKDMISRVEEKIGAEDAEEPTKKLKGYMSGSDVFSQGEVSSEMSTLLRLLT
jgi:hypothetical protein